MLGIKNYCNLRFLVFCAFYVVFHLHYNIHFNQNVNSAEKSTTKVRGTSLLLCYYLLLIYKCIKVSYIKNEKSRISIFRSSFVVVVVVGFTKISIYYPLSFDNRGAVETDSSV